MIGECIGVGEWIHILVWHDRGMYWGGEWIHILVWHDRGMYWGGEWIHILVRHDRGMYWVESGYTFWSGMIGECIGVKS